MDRFVNREDEFSRLRRCYESDDAVVYQTTETTSQIQLDEFVDVASETFPGITRIKQD